MTGANPNNDRDFLVIPFYRGLFKILECLTPSFLVGGILGRKGKSYKFPDIL